MGHDEHFLRRLDRVSDNHVEISLTLYRDEALLREVLSRAELPPGAERLAISLNDAVEGPFVIVTRAGKFVTCLGEGMKVGSDLVVLTRPRLDAAIAKVERMRERIARVTALEREGKDGTAQRLFKKLATDALLFCREDAQSLIEFWPLIGRDASVSLAELVRAIARHRNYIAGFRFDKLSQSERRSVGHFGSIVWAASNLLVLTTEQESAEYFDEISAARDIDARSIIWRNLFELGTYTHSLRVLWSIGQRRKRGLETLRKMRDIEDFDAAAMREMGLGVLAMSTPKVRAEAIKEMTRKYEATLAPDASPRERVLHTLRTYASGYGQVAQAVLANEAAFDASYLADGRWVAATVQHPEADDAHVEAVSADIPEDVARAILPTMAWSWLKEDCSTRFACALPWLARAKPTELFLPRAYTATLPPTDEQEVDWMMAGYGEAHRLRRASTVRNEAPKVGRNDPCGCGSGKKHKRCCGAG